ncbi:V-type ATP synthase subunit D [Endozoicomonas sp. OPT23]|uniref:V-type ATP synthase subunit D n=1 Tax=Endozoicomonas sp. OPT23 TaxID=2072845 RepID=UPI00129B2E18|nr:V-type ATP synthase subunit D [Endozoicomonas sp. OPT23]MRI32381.1 V-type ATP synthase subunit D [Endozoicomonas sp. OPT23]
MTSLTLSKSTLNREKQNLKAYNRYLPALELKRQQLLVELQKAEIAIEEAEQKLGNVLEQVARELPMLSRKDVDVEPLVKIEKTEIREENIVGTRVPILHELKLRVIPYSDLAMPHWVDMYVELMQQALTWQLEHHIRKERLEKLAKASQTTAQRVNLFSKVLIPKGKKNIQKIQIYLSDQDRASIINAKLAKARGHIKPNYREQLQVHS